MDSPQQNLLPPIDQPPAVAEELGRGHQKKIASTLLKDFSINGAIPLGLAALHKESYGQHLGPAVDSEPPLEPSDGAEPSIHRPSSPLPVKETMMNEFGLYKRYETSEEIPHDPNTYVSASDLQEVPGADLISALELTDSTHGPKEQQDPNNPTLGSEFYLYPNASSFMLGDWFWEEGGEKSEETFQRLILIVGSDSFIPEDVRVANWSFINHVLGTSEFEKSAEGSHWHEDGTSWKKTLVTINVPFNSVSKQPRVQPYTIHKFRYRPLVPLITKELKSAGSQQFFHHVPHELWWKPGKDKADVHVYCETYQSDASLEAHWEIHVRPPLPFLSTCSVDPIVCCSLQNLPHPTQAVINAHAAWLGSCLLQMLRCWLPLAMLSSGPSICSSQTI